MYFYGPSKTQYSFKYICNNYGHPTRKNWNAIQTSMTKRREMVDKDIKTPNHIST